MTKTNASDIRIPHLKEPWPLYLKWQNMINRCRYPYFRGYANYGGRGIKVCREWSTSYVAFRDWALANGYHPKLQLDRDDNDGDYTPANCRFVGKIESCSNLRKNIFLEWNGKRQTIAQWAREFGVRPQWIEYRYHKGWGAERILTTLSDRGQ